MTKTRYETGKAPALTVESCTGSLVVKGWDENAVAVRGDHESSEEVDTITIRSDGSIAVWAPRQSSLALQKVHGDAVVKGIEGEVRLDEVMGDAAVKHGATLEIGAVHGDLAAAHIEGTVAVTEVMGDAALRHIGGLEAQVIHGDLALRYLSGAGNLSQVMGDVSINTVNGDVSIAQCHRDISITNSSGKLTASAMGDIRLRGGLAAGKHNLSAGGDVVVRWPLSEPVNLLVTAGEVKNKLELDEESEDENGAFSGRIGDGDTTLIIEAGGRVELKPVEEEQWSSDMQKEWGDFGQTFGNSFAGLGAEMAGIGAQITGEVSAHMHELSKRMEERFDADFTQRIAERAAHKAERAIKRAMHQAERASRRAEGWSSPRPATSTKASAGASTEEQMKILSMLEGGAITVSEAETLLKALER